MPKRIAAVLLFTLVCGPIVVETREASACSPRGPAVEVSVPIASTSVPKDGFVPIAVSAAAGAGLSVDLRDDRGELVGTTLDDAPEAGAKLLRPAAGEFPVGTLRLTLRYTSAATRAEATQAVDLRISDATIAAWQPAIQALKIDVATVADATAPPVRCDHLESAAGQCSYAGPSEIAKRTDIASRVKKVPQLSYQLDRPEWALHLFTPTHRYTVRGADGASREEPANGFGHTFDAIGVEYCAELTMVPLYGVAIPARTTSACVPNGAATYAVTQSDHDAYIRAFADGLKCTQLEFPDDVRVPEGLEERSEGGAGGCSTSPSGARDGSASLLLLSVAAALAVRKRREAAPATAPEVSGRA